jgi:signal transduction histidine kinase
MLQLWKKLSETYKIFISMLIFIMFIQLSTLVYIWKFETRVLVKKEQKNLSYQLEIDADLLLNHLKGLKKEAEFLSTLEVMDDLLTKDIDKRIAILLSKKAKDLGEKIVLTVRKKAETVASSKSYYVRKNYLIFSVPIYASFNKSKKIGILELLYPLHNLMHLTMNNPMQHLWLTPLEKKDGFVVPQHLESIVVTKTLHSMLEGWKLSLAYEKEEALHSIKEIEKVLLIAFLVSLFALLFVVWRLSKRQMNILQHTEEVLELKRTFLSTMSHELRTPLGSILNLTQHLMISPKISDDDVEMLKRIENSSEHLLAMINNLLQLSKLESNSMHVEKEKVDVSEVVEEMIEIVEPLIFEKELRLEKSIKVENPSLTTDVNLFKQVVINLLSNSIKYTNEGSIKISLTQSNDEFILEVIDTGIGIKKEKQEELFTEFYQAHVKSSGVKHSIGLGLALSQKVAKLINGQIEIFSEGEGRGVKATFRFRSL